ncbi:hypothetical protein ACIQUQ_27640 [Streptomyces sp. NPDC101118]|uniref:hypothetical protein n=1 Tax=Streptomyces sp. NPDC101118 TaxID=3366109 RepID=UPI0038193A7F
MGLNTDLTEAQKRALKENADDLEQFRRQLDEVHERARSRLESAGLVPGLDALNCLICVVCKGWKSGPGGKCANCPHDLFSHNII